MKKRLFVILLALVLTMLLAGCGCKHEWYAATCSAPKTCNLCGATEGDALPHTWEDATCTDAKTCSVCNAIDGEPIGHTWQNANCIVPKTCSVCNTTEGEPAGHTWQNATCTEPKTCSVCKITEGKVAAHKWLDATTEAPKTCSVCKATEGSELKTDSRFTTASTKHLQGTWVCDTTITDEMMELKNFGNIDVQFTLKFGNTGELTQTITVKDEKGFLTKLKKYTVDTMYDSFAEQGLSKEQGDQAMLEAYGLNVNEYVDASLKGYDINAAFKAYTFEEVYYVEDGAIFTALSWKANFEKSAYTLENGKLKIDGLSVDDSCEPLIWTKK